MLCTKYANRLTCTNYTKTSLQNLWQCNLSDITI
jgi:hypothetical protein